MSYVLVFVFCFKQKTAYEVRISDWSSDVCSSDLPCGASAALGGSPAPEARFSPSLHIPFLAGKAEPVAVATGFQPQRKGRHHGTDHRQSSRHLSGNHRSDNSDDRGRHRSEEHTSEIKSLMRISYAVLGLKKKTYRHTQ